MEPSEILSENIKNRKLSNFYGKVTEFLKAYNLVSAEYISHNVCFHSTFRMNHNSIVSREAGLFLF
mgnify:CR=1 FL=1